MKASSPQQPTHWVRLWRFLGLDGLEDDQAVRFIAILALLNGLDELDTAAFGVLSPEIRDHFGLSNTGIATIGVLSIPLVVLVALPVGFYADRWNRSRMAVVSAFVLAAASFLTGFAPIVLLLAGFRAVAGIGQSINAPVHESLIADYVPRDNRAGAYSLWYLANPIGRLVAPLVAGGVAIFLGWRIAFVTIAVIAAASIPLAFRLREPSRGAHERRAAGGSDDLVALEERPPQWEEAWRSLSAVRSLRRIWYAFPFLVGGLLGIGVLLPLYLDDVFGVNELGRGVFFAASEPFEIAGLAVGIPISTRLLRDRPSRAFSLLGIVGVIVAAGFLAIAAAPNLIVVAIASFTVAFAGAVLEPATVALASLVTPPRARGFSIGVFALWILPGLVFVVVAASIGDAHGLRTGVAAMAPVFLIGALIAATAGSSVEEDIASVERASLAQAESHRARLAGETKLLMCRGIDVAYDQVQVLFGVDFDAEEGEIVALLGTNGAGKSTLLKAIAGLIVPSAGAVLIDGGDSTHATPQQRFADGVVYMPGGRSIFPTLTVEDNVRVAAWRVSANTDDEIEGALARFPRLRERWAEAAGELSGGEQQMLGLAMALLARPRLLMIDELSLGLAPNIVAQLLDAVRTIHQGGTTVVLVEQSVNVALELAERAVFLEKGEVKFQGPARELLDRPDVLRSVFLEGAAAALRSGAQPADVPARSNGSQRDGAAAIVLELDGISKSYNSVTAVDAVGLTLHENEILGLIGPNGAGKTTLLDLISGFLPPDAGTIRLSGHDITTWSAARRSRAGVGRSFQDARLFPSMTVRQAIATSHHRHLAHRDPLSVAAMLPDVALENRLTEERTDELIELLFLEAYRDKAIAELSTGTRRIVDLAGCIAHRPAVLLLDEPSSGIAQREAEALGPLLRRIQQLTGASMIVIEHDMPLITHVSDALIALDLGRVIASGSSEHVLADPAVVSSYLGTDASTINRSGNQRPPREARRRVSANGGPR